MDSSDLEKLVEKIVNYAQQGSRQSRDGSHLTDEALQKSYDEIDKKIKDIDDTYFDNLTKLTSGLSAIEESINNADSAFDEIEQQLQKTGKTQAEIDDLRQKYKDDLTQKKDDIVKSLSEFDDGIDKTKEALTKAKDEIEKNANKEAQNNIARKLTGGESDRVARYGENLFEFGDSLKKISGKGGIGKFGGALATAGGALTRFAGPIGAVIWGLQKFHQLIMGMWENSITRRANAYEYQATAMGINTAQMRSENQMALTAQEANNKMLGSSIQFAKTATQALGALAQDKAAAYGEVGLEGVQIGAEGYAKSHEIAAKAPFDIKGAAYAAANAALELGGQATMFEKNKGFAEENVGLSERKTASEIGNARTQMLEDIKLTKITAENSLALKEKQKDVDYESKTLDLQNNRNQKEYEENRAAWTTYTLGIANVWYDWLGGDLRHKSEQSDLENQAMLRKRTLDRELAEKEYDTARMNYEANRSAMIKKAQSELANMQVQNEVALAKSKLQTQKTLESKLIESAKKINQAWMDMTQALNDEFLKMETSSMKMGRDMGLDGEQLHKYSQNMGQMQVQVARWGKNLEWMQKTQESFQETTGRNIQYSARDFTTTAAVGTLVGDDIVNQLDAGMEIFNSSVADSNTMFYEMYKSVSKMGLNGKKFGKDLVNNLKLAEKYNFKGGVKSLMEMSKWAQNMRFNVGSLDGMLDKVQEGGLEGVIKQAAELQVLGGNFAMGSDPMAMAYESYMDPEGYAKRMNGMIAGQGMFDEKTGEVSFGIASQQMMRQFAKSTGQDYKDVLNQARQMAKIKQINKTLNPNGQFTEEQQSLIANKATYNKENQSWEVKTLDGQTKDVSQLTQEDMANLGPEEGEDPQATMVDLQTQMLEKISTIYSKQEAMEIAQTEMKSFLMGDSWLALENTNQTMIDTMRSEFYANIDKYRAKVSENLNIIKNAPQQFFEIWRKGNEAIDKKCDQILTAAKNIDLTINKCWQDGMGYIGKCMATYAQGAGIDFNIGEFKLPETPKKENRTSEEKPDNKNFWRDVITSAGIGAVVGSVAGGGVLSWATTGVGALVGGAIGLGSGLWNYFTDDGEINTQGNLTKINDGTVSNKGNVSKISGNKNTNIASTPKNSVQQKINDGTVIQNGKATKINADDQVLAAKKGGPIDRMLDTVNVLSSEGAIPRPMAYDSYVKERPYQQNNSIGSDKIEVAPIQININGNIQLNSANGTADITQQIANDPNFVRSLSQLISLEVEKKVRGGRVNNPMNRGLEFS